MRTPGDSHRESEALQLARLQGAVASVAGEEQLLSTQTPQQIARETGVLFLSAVRGGSPWP